jgi:tetratricopeptide (TPR) repeat protein
MNLTLLPEGEIISMSNDLLPTINRRYQLLSRIGSGGMGVVYRALDRLTGQIVALKQVTWIADTSLASENSKLDLRLILTREFKTLASLRHPHIISVLDYGFGAPDENGQRQPFFTMDLLEDAEEIVKAARDLPLSEQVELLIQMLYAIAYLHRRGILHRDLKPGNVVVVNGEVKVLDFGVSINRDQQTEGHPAGTLAYMAPELLQGDHASEASDLYSVGMIAYEMFTGRFPFEFSDITQLLKQIMTTPVNIFIEGVDSGISHVLGRLLAKSPDDRYASAHETMVALSVAVDKTVPRETSLVRESFLQAAKFVGRGLELSELTQALARTVDERTGSAWLIGGESGAGKSRLIDELGTRALVEGAFVLRGHATDKSNDPYDMWREILRRLTLQIDLSELEASVLKNFVPDITALLEYDIPDAPSLDPQATQERLHHVIRDMLRRCCEAQSYVIILEDLHWAENEGLALLEYLLTETRDLPVLWVASYRDDEQPEVPKHLPAMKLLRLDRLTSHDIALLSESMLGAAGRQENVVDLLQRETEGNVFFMVEVVRALAEDAGTLEQVGIKTLPEKVFAGGLELVIRRRLDRLPSWTHPMLHVAAVAGRQLDTKVFKQIDPKIDLENWLTTCSDVAVLDVQDERWRFAHDKLREGVLAELSEVRRKQLHGQVAWAIEHVYPDDPAQAATLTYHWRALGDATKVAHYARLAGQQSVRYGANRAAKTFFEQALDATNQLPRSDSQRRQFIDTALDLGHAASAFPSENVTHALSHALKLAEELGDDGRKARIMGSMGTFLYVSGNMGEALGYFSQCVTLAEKLGIEELLPMPYGMLGRALVIAGDLPKATYLLSKSVELAEKFNDLDMQSGSMAWLGTAFLQQSQPEKGLSLFARSLELVEQLGNPSRTAATLLFIGVGYTYSGYYDEAVEVLKRCLTIAQQEQSHVTAYNAAGNLGVVLYELGEVDEARLHLDMSLNLAQITNSVVGVPFFQTYRALLDFETGVNPIAAIEATNQAMKLAEITRQSGLKSHVVRILGTMYARLPQPDYSQALSLISQGVEFGRTGSINPTTAYALLELGKLYTTLGAVDEARTALEEAYALCERTGMRHHMRRIESLLTSR